MTPSMLIAELRDKNSALDCAKCGTRVVMTAFSNADHVVLCAPCWSVLLDIAEAAIKLSNEASGFLAHADEADHGWTNIRVLRERIEETRAAIHRLTEAAK